MVVIVVDVVGRAVKISVVLNIGELVVSTFVDPLRFSVV